MSARSTIVLTMRCSERALQTEQLWVLTLAKYIFLNRLWMFIRKKTILDWHPGRSFSKRIAMRSAHLEVPRNFLCPLRNQSLGVATNLEPPTHIRDDLFPNLQTGPQVHPLAAVVQLGNTYIDNPNRGPSGFLEWLVVFLVIADSRIIVLHCLVWVPPSVLHKK
jgi:hypothetical protein